MADSFVKRVILVNEIRTAVKGNLNAPILQGKNFNKVLLEQDNIINKTSKSSKGYWSALTKARISFFNVALAVGIASIAYKKLTGAATEANLSITKISAVTGESNKVLTEQIKLLQFGTIFSLKEVADAYLEVSKRGFDASESFKIVSASTDLAIGGFTTLATASTLVTQTINQFGLSAESAGHIANVFAGAAVLTAANMETLTTSMSMVGQIADQANVSFENTAAALGILMDAGLRATKAGTGLRAMLNKILSPSAEAKTIMQDLGISLFNVEGNIKSLDRIMIDFSDALSQTADDEERLDSLMTVFGIRGGPAAAALFKQYESGGKTISKLTAEMNTLAFAQEQASVQMEALANRSKKATKSLEADFLEIGLGVKTLGTYFTEAFATPEIHKQSIMFVEMAQNLDTLGESGKQASKELLTMSNLSLLTPGALDVLVRGDVITKELAKSASELNKEEVKSIGFSEAKEQAMGKLNDINRENLSIRDEVLRQEFELNAIRSYNSETLIDSIKAQGDYAEKLELSSDAVGAHSKKLEEAKSIERSAGEAMNELLQNHISFNDELVDLGKVGAWAREIENSGEITEEVANQIIAYNDAVNAAKGDVGKGQNAFIALSDTLDVMNTKFNALIPAEELASRALEKLTKGWIASVDSAVEFNRVSENTANQVKELISEYVRLSTKQEEWKGTLEDTKDALKDLNEQLKDYEKLVSDVLGKRFAGEGRVQKIIYEQEKALKEADLAAMGVSDAYNFLGNAVVLTEDNYEELKGTIEDVTDAAKNSASAFDAWQTSIREHVRALILEGSDLGTDVSSSVKTQATRGLSLGLFSDGGETEDDKRRRLMEENLEKLRLANEVTYGDMHQQLTFYNQDHEDSINDVNANVESAMSELDLYWAKIEDLNSQIEEQIAIQDAAAEKIKEYEEGLNEIDLAPFISEIDAAIKKVEDLMQIKDKVGSTSTEVINEPSNGAGGGDGTGVGEVIRAIRSGTTMEQVLGETKGVASEKISKTNIENVSITIPGTNKDGDSLAREIFNKLKSFANS